MLIVRNPRFPVNNACDKSRNSSFSTRYLGVELTPPRSDRQIRATDFNLCAKVAPPYMYTSWVD